MFEKPMKVDKRDSSVTVMLTAEEKRYLWETAESTGIRVSDLIRIGLRHVAELHNKGELNNE